MSSELHTIKESNDVSFMIYVFIVKLFEESQE